MNWYKLVTDIMTSCKSIIDGYVLRKKLPNNPVIIFDIDGTLFEDGTQIPIMPVVNFYNYILSKGITPIIITARNNTSYVKNITENMLKNYGVKNYSEIHFMNWNTEISDKYKLKKRHDITSRDYSIIMSIGDNLFDSQPYGGVSVLIPKKY